MNKILAMFENALENGAELKFDRDGVSIELAWLGSPDADYTVTAGIANPVYEGDSLFDAMQAFDQACFEDEGQ